MTYDLFQQHTGRALRDEGMARVMDNAGPLWRDRAIAMLREFCRHHSTFIGEDFRIWATLRGLPVPHHPNAYGGLLSGATKQGICSITNQNRTMNMPKSHARRSPVWQSNIYGAEK